MRKNKKGLTLLELVIAIMLLGVIVLAASQSSRIGLEFIKSVRKRVGLQNKANLAMEYIIRDGRTSKLQSPNSDGRTDRLVFENGSRYRFTNKGLRYNNFAGNDTLEGLNDGNGSYFDIDGRLIKIHIEGKQTDVTGKEEKAKEITLDSQVYRRVMD